MTNYFLYSMNPNKEAYQKFARTIFFITLWTDLGRKKVTESEG